MYEWVMHGTTALRFLMALIVACTALGVALVMQARGRHRAACWLFCVGWFATLALSALDWIANALVLPGLGWQGMQLISSGLYLVDMVIFLLIGAGIYLMRPEPEA